MRRNHSRVVTQVEAPTRIADLGELVNLRCSALVLRGEEVLLCRRLDSENTWVLPGGTPKSGEGTAAAAQREVAEETGLIITAERVAFVLETTSRDVSHHLIEIVFVGTEQEKLVQPRQKEAGLLPMFAALDGLGDLGLRPPIAGYIRGYAKYQQSGSRSPSAYTAAYLGNLWRAIDNEDSPGPS